MTGITIGCFALVGAGSVVTRDVPDHALVFGNPAKIRGWVCACARKLAVDLDYVRSHTFGGDLRILGRTAMAIAARAFRRGSPSPPR